MVETTACPTRIFIFEGGGVIWKKKNKKNKKNKKKKKKKKNGRDKVVCYSNKTG